METNTILALLIPFAGTTAGSALVFFIRDGIPARLQKAMLGFASGVMVAASVWSLLIPSINMCADRGRLATVPALIGLLCGFAFLLMIDRITPHIHTGGQKEGPRSNLSKTAMLALAVTIHNLPEGMAAGISDTIALSLGIAIQNIPEGAIISMPMLAAGNSKWKSFLIGSLSGIVEPIGGVLILLLASSITAAVPYLLAFAAGAMLYVVVEELIPETAEGEHSNIGTIGFALGFALMMVLDTVMG